VSSISQAYADRVEVRGRDLTGDLMGRLSFTEYFHLLLTGDEPTDDQRFFLDLLLVAIAEHGMMPTNVAARMTLAADPDRCRAPLRPDLSADRPPRHPAELLAPVQRSAQAEPDEAARARGRRAQSRAGIPCTSRSTRAEQILELADARGSGPASSPVSCATRSPRRGQALPMNVSMPVAAVLLDLGFPSRPSSRCRSSPGRPGRRDPPRSGAAGRLHARARGRGRRRLRA
jgi:citrate synthase